MQCASQTHEATHEVEVDADVDGLDVNASCEQVGADQVASRAVAEFVEHSVPMRLQHLRVDVQARVAELRDLLRQQLHTAHRVAENDGLVDLQLPMEHTVRHNKHDASTVGAHTLEKRVLRQCTFCLSSTNA